MSPLEGRGVVTTWDHRLEQLLVYSSTQQPHIVRTGLSECLGIEHARIRVVAPDVGGAFGYKGILLPEEICLAWATIQLGYPLKWLEDRRENLTASTNCREHHYTITAYGDASGKLLAIDAEATVDSGAYSSYPFSACLEAAQVVSILPGLYDLEGYRCRTYAVATNKPPILPYRGVARAGVCFALELMVDALARELALDPTEVRFRSLVGPQQMPFDNITTNILTAAITQNPCGRRLPRLISTLFAPDKQSPNPMGAESVWVLRCTQNRPPMGLPSMPAGGSRWCLGTSNVRPG
ncbi:MAG: hypothetical protein CM1200mP41_32540 [Gammaproteobacteria bacterium]|nr:MAG: hypothetical protein CM1200mP41_32540 [Gammaproteobacteria bacterium]